MIVGLRKFLIYGNRSERDRFFESAQKSGYIEFIGLSHKKNLEMPESAKTILAAIKIARAHTSPAKSVYHPTQDPLSLAEHIVQSAKDYEKLLEEKRMLKMEIARISPFGNFSREELDLFEKEGKRVVQFFIMRSEQIGEMKWPDEMIHLANAFDLSYFMTINKEKKQYPKMTEVVIEKPLQELKERAKWVGREIADLEKKIHDSAKAHTYLQKALFDALNEYDLRMVKHDAAQPLADTLFAIEAWVPETKKNAFFSLIASLNVMAEEILIEEKDRVPTYMENKGAAKMGEDLVQVYDTPAATDNDPSLWILVFFALFFAIIISDAGYGAIYLGIGLWLKYRMENPAPVVQRFIKTVILVGTCCVIWGAATASFFGLELHPNNPLRSVSFLSYMATKKADYHVRLKDSTYKEYVDDYPMVEQAQTGKEFLMAASEKENFEALNSFQDAVLMELSLLIGVIHIALSFLRYLTRNWAGVGWILFLVGGYLYFPSFVDATSLVNYLGWISKEMSVIVGEKMLFAGLALVFCISWFEKRRIGAALHELTNSIQVFGDVLSYLRLYALALAGMMMASTFNGLAMQTGIFGILIAIVGHGINMLLAVMSGTIHGLRLNFLEWYHYCFEGGGKTFNPLRIRKTIQK